MPRIATPVLLLLLPLAVFLTLFHPATLDIGNAGWLIRGTDNGENALGMHAWLHEPTTQLSPRTTLLNAPDGVALLFTDSNPLLGIVVKPFASLLPADAQLVGPWVLLCLVLNAVFAWLLLRRHAPGPLALWAGVVLLAFPPTLANRFIHTNLMAHWTILAALYLFLDRERGRKFGWWSALIVTTTLIHSYLLIMVGAIWASRLLTRFVKGSRRERVLVLGQGAAGVALVVLLAEWLGVGGLIPTSNFGVYSMPLDGLWNPGLDRYSQFLPGSERSPGRDYEGFQYMGVGGLLLIGAAMLAASREAPSRAARATTLRLRAFVPAMVVLAVLAIADPRGLPLWLIHALDPVRASGRLFWPIGYVLMLVALLSVYRWRRRAAPLLAMLLVIQVIDVSGQIRSVRAASAQAGRHQLYVRTLDSRWDKLIAEARDIAFIPGDPTRDLALFQEIAWRAAKAGRPLTSVYAARTPTVTAQRLAAEEAAFVRGELVPGRLYIILPDALLPPIGPSLKTTIDNVSLIPASSRR